MNRTRSILAGALGALFAVAAAGVASAQTATPPRNDNSATQTRKTTAQEQFDREKVTLKDQVQSEIDRTDANIDALKKIADSEKGPAKKTAEDAEKKISTMRDHLKDDLGKIDKASMNDWKGVKPVVDRDLNATTAELNRVASITKLPTTGAAQRQAPNQPPPAPKQPQKK